MNSDLQREGQIVYIYIYICIVAQRERDREWREICRPVFSLSFSLLTLDIHLFTPKLGERERERKSGERSGPQRVSLSLYTFIYIHVWIYTYFRVCRERERESERWWKCCNTQRNCWHPNHKFLRKKYCLPYLFICFIWMFFAWWFGNY